MVVMHCSDTMKSTTTTRTRVDEILRAPSVRAPSLAKAIDAMMALADDPGCRRAKVTVGLLEKQGALDCPACGTRFDVRGYRETRTSYGETRSMTCRGCRACFVVDETHVA